MINIENKVYSLVSTAVKTNYSTASTYSEPVETPASFPCVVLYESNNAVYTETQDSSSIENHAMVTYECDIYSNAKSGKKTQAKAIAQIVDGIMSSKGFTRTFCDQIPNIDRTIFRIVMRYEGIVDSGTTSGTTTTYKIYRK